jgi:hypothetical protein
LTLRRPGELSSPALPPGLRRRLADAIVGALRDEGARQALGGLGASREAARRWCGASGQEYGDLVQARARRAVRALASVPVHDGRDLGEDLEASAALFDAALFFETHEVLEPHWRQASGQVREIIQGLIQIAVGYEHWAHGNVIGARSLLAQGSARLRGRRLRGTHLDSFADAVCSAREQIEGREPSPPPFPRPSRRRTDSP